MCFDSPLNVKKTATGMLRLLSLGREPGFPDKGQAVPDDPDDILPVNQHDGRHRAQMEKDFKEHVSLLRRLHVEHVLQHRQMAGAGDGQEFRHTLYKAQKDRG